MQIQQCWHFCRVIFSERQKQGASACVSALAPSISFRPFVKTLGRDWSESRWYGGIQVVEMKKSSLRSLGGSERLLSLLPECDIKRPCTSKSCRALRPAVLFLNGISVILSPWWTLLLVAHFPHGIAASPGQRQWVRLNHTKSPEKEPVRSHVQIVFFCGFGFSP